MGFCKCHTGYYGTDCMRKMAGAVLEKGGWMGGWVQAGETCIVTTLLMC